MPLIELKNIDFSYGKDIVVLNGLNLTLKKGQKVLLSGGNGAGKTTLFHIILGLLPPEKGTIKLFGKYCKKEEDFFEPRKRIGLLFQDVDDQLFSPSVIEDVAFGPLNLGLSHKEALLKARNTLDSLGILHLEKRVPYELSGGEKKLVALATILAMEPQVLLLDEPLVGLEKKAVKRVITVLNDKKFDAFIIISHLHEFLKDVVNCSWLLEKGKLTFQ